MVSNLDAVKEMGKKVAKGLGYAVAYPLANPTFWIKAYKNEIHETGCVIGTGFAFVGSLLCFGYGLEEGNPYALACGVTILSTNAISGLYEWYRYEKNKIKNFEPELKKEPSELEVKVEEPIETKPIIVTKPVKPHFVNPWEIEIKD